MKRDWRHPGRAGFTLVEVLVVLTIVLVLASLLILGVQAGSAALTRNQRFFQVNQLGEAVEKFQREHKTYPPSRIYLLEDGNYATGQADLDEEVRVRSLSALNKIFPGIRLNRPGAAFDWNGDGDTDDRFLLTGDQALVFFLFGVPQQYPAISAFDPASGNPITIEGFALGDNPAPLLNVSGNTIEVVERNQPVLIATDFTGDLYWKPAETLAEVAGGAASTDVLMPVIVDRQAYDDNPDAQTGSPRILAAPAVGVPSVAIYYFSSYNGAGYVALDGGWEAHGGGSPGEEAEGTALVTDLDGTGTADDIAPNPYQTAEGSWINGSTFQLIAPGSDGLYGPGGRLGITTADLRTDELLANGRTFGGGDNVTNFFSGLLEAYGQNE